MLKGFKKIDLADFIGRNRSFVSALEYDNGIDVDYYLNDKNELRAEVHFGERSMGPPDHVHGGAMAAVLDEAMGIACWFKMLPVVTRTLTTHFLRMVPIDTTVVLRTTVMDGVGSDVRTVAVMVDPEDDLEYASAEGIFKKLSQSKLDKLGLDR